jgi:hypothetical protein
MSDDRQDHAQLDRIEQMLTILTAQGDEIHALATRAAEAALLENKPLGRRAPGRRTKRSGAAVHTAPKPKKIRA